MGKYQRKDHYYRKAKEQGLPSRATFKIDEIQNKFNLLKPGDKAIDLGAAPGGWTVKLLETVGPQGKVFALDLQDLNKIQGKNLHFYHGDAFGPEAQKWLEEYLESQKVQGVYSDLSPKLSGIAFRDAYLSFELCEQAFQVAKKFLLPGGHFVTKIFPGEEFNGFVKSLKKDFKNVKIFEPKSTRKTSREVYLLGIDYLSETED